LSAAFEACLSNGQNRFSSEALFNRLEIEPWKRRALGCLELDRREFAACLQERGWSYDPRTHHWSRRPETAGATVEPTLFG
jgi:hypothetical protein